MSNTHETLVSEMSQPRADYPVLTALRLTTDELHELQNQGFINREQRGDRTIYKLRFRHGGRQQVRFIGNEEQAARVRAELARLQAGLNAARQLRALDRQARTMLREAKRTLAPLLAGYGYAFHGQAIRRPRPANQN